MTESVILQKGKRDDYNHIERKEDNSEHDASKRQKTDDCNHIEEMERMKEEVKQKNDNISDLKKTIKDLKRKQKYFLQEIERLKNCVSSSS